MAAKKKKKVKHFYDYSLVFAVLFITGFGMLMMYSASSYTQANLTGDPMYLLKRQAVFAVMGIAAMLIISLFDYHLLARFAKPIYLLSVLFLAGTFVMGIASHGSSRWISLFGIRFQPSELVKISVIIMLAKLLTRYSREINEWRVALLCVGPWAFVPALVIATSNLSTAIIIMGIAMVMLFVASRKYWPFLLMGGIVGFVYVFAYPVAKLCESIGLLQEYQLTRIFMWKDPASYSNETFQTLQGLYAIGSGGLFGKGLGESIQKFLMPEAQNDMIFTIICEELGLFGAVSVILIFAFIIYRMLVIATSARDLFGSMLVIGIMSHIALQVILNIAVVTNSIPNTGITLPFISYGGTALLLLMGEVGIVLSVSRQIRLENR